MPKLFTIFYILSNSVETRCMGCYLILNRFITFYVAPLFFLNLLLTNYRYRLCCRFFNDNLKPNSGRCVRAVIYRSAASRLLMWPLSHSSRHDLSCSRRRFPTRTYNCRTAVPTSVPPSCLALESIALISAQDTNNARTRGSEQITINSSSLLSNNN